MGTIQVHSQSWTVDRAAAPLRARRGAAQPSSLPFPYVVENALKATHSRELAAMRAILEAIP